MSDKCLPNVLSRMFKSNSRPERDFVRAGDAARDAKRWIDAVANYTAYLSLVPDNQKIHIQRGNCLKEAGRLDQALDAYDTAMNLDDKDADVYLQRGHLLKVMGRLHEAARSYSKSVEHNQHDNPAFEELIFLKQAGILEKEASTSREAGNSAEVTTLVTRERDRAPPSDRPKIYLDIIDLVDYLRHNVSLSGIQRVVANLLLNATEFSEGHGGIPVLPDYNGDQIFSVRISLLDGLLGMVATGLSSREDLNSALELIHGSKTPVSLEPGDTLVIAGAFWIYHRYDLLNTLRYNQVNIVVFIHDLIQITNPQYVEPKATAIFHRGFADILLVASSILTNSEFVASEVRRHMRHHLNLPIPVKTITLATELGTKQIDRHGVQKEYIDLAKEEYVLCVGTIEIRKNHIYLIKIWERMIAENRIPVPNLVLVGKWGWEIDDLHKYLAKSDYLGGRLFIYNGISDMDLAYFYDNCLMTIYPSFAEGWGLPVGESLGYGKPCIASGVTAIPEVGGSLCRYIDPFDIDNGYDVITSTLEDRSDLNAWTGRVRDSFMVKTWYSFSFELLNAVKDFVQQIGLAKAGNNFVLEPSQIAYFGHDNLNNSEIKPRRINAARMTRVIGWHNLEGWGCWTMRRRASLRFRTTLQADHDAVLYMNLRTAEGDELADCTVKSGAFVTRIEDLTPIARWCSVPVEVDGDGVVEISLNSGRGYNHLHGREIYIGIIALAITPSNDLVARLNLLNAIVPDIDGPQSAAEYIAPSKLRVIS